MEHPVVSIICTVYNHEPYLRDCLDGFVSQKTDFPFEIIIHDDASTDGSQEIIIEYVKRYPDLFVPILQQENQYSKKVSIRRTFIYPQVRGKYVAECEGDDYWIDSNKLQEQVDFLEANEDYSIVHSKIYHLVDGKMQNDHVNRSKCAFEDLLFGNVVSTLSALMRKDTLFDAISLFETHPELRSKYMGDYPLFLMMSSLGKVKYIDQYQGVYRITSGTLSRPKSKYSRYQFDREVVQIKKKFYNYARNNSLVFCTWKYNVKFNAVLFHNYKRLLFNYGVMAKADIFSLFFRLPYAILNKFCEV